MSFAVDRYDHMQYRRCGRSGLLLPAVSLGGWQAIGSYRAEEASFAIFKAAFDVGITHFDFANNYGRPAGASEELFGNIVNQFPREELVISSKAGYRMWPGPYGEWGSRKSLIQSCEQSLKRLKLDHLDIFYSHRPDPDTPLEETIGALEDIVRQGKALYAGISNYPDPRFSEAVAITKQRGWAPITIHQPRYHLFERGVEQTVLPTAGKEGVGVIVFSPLAQGILTDRYLNGIPPGSRAAADPGNGGIGRGAVTEAVIGKVRQLNEIAKSRGQTMAQMALSWVLKDARVTSVLIGASAPEQVQQNVVCIQNLHFTAEELQAIDAICAST